MLLGGLIAWRDIIQAAMRLQSQNALGQAGLLIGANKVVRVDVPESDDPIELDDWLRSSQELPEVANATLVDNASRVAERFLSKRAVPYAPVTQP